MDIKKCILLSTVLALCGVKHARCMDEFTGCGSLVTKGPTSMDHAQVGQLSEELAKYRACSREIDYLKKDNEDIENTATIVGGFIPAGITAYKVWGFAQERKVDTFDESGVLVTWLVTWVAGVAYLVSICSLYSLPPGWVSWLFRQNPYGADAQVRKRMTRCETKIMQGIKTKDILKSDLQALFNQESDKGTKRFINGLIMRYDDYASLADEVQTLS